MEKFSEIGISYTLFTAGHTYIQQKFVKTYIFSIDILDSIL